MLFETSISMYKKGGEEPRYLSSNKKRYYLASNEDSVETLIKQQKEELTRVLIGLKSEYDKTKLEIRKKTAELEEFDKQIKLLEKVHQKTEKKLVKAFSQNDIYKDAISIKRKTKEEELYNQKSLKMMIGRIKQDIWLIKKEVNDLDFEKIRLDKEYKKEIFIASEIKQEKNNVYSEILSQNRKNAFEKNEQTLKLKYYNTIIEQKYAFIQSADERKERRRKIEEGAKKESSDKLEVEKRINLGLLRLQNCYYKKKMDLLIQSYSDIEKVYNKIKICTGTSDPKIMIEKIINKDKNYNYLTRIASTKEEEKAKLKKEIAELKAEVTKLESENIPKEYSSFIKDNEKEKLIITEKNLKTKLNTMVQTKKEILSTYLRVRENIFGLYNNYNKDSGVNTLNTSEQNINANTANETYVTNVNEVQVGSLSDDELLEMYQQFLQFSMKKFEMLFLCHSKQEFKKMMEEKGKGNQKQYEVNIKEFYPFSTRGSLNSLKRNSSDAMMLYNTNHEKDKKKKVKSKEKILQDEIFTSFMNKYKQNAREMAGLKAVPK